MASYQSGVIYFPMPMTFDAGEIAAGRYRALDMYRSARSPKVRMRALIWVNHWRQLYERAKMLNEIGLRA
jgi:hypothetical protein